MSSELTFKCAHIVDFEKVTRKAEVDKIISERVDCVMRLRMKDINGQIVYGQFTISHILIMANLSYLVKMLMDIWYLVYLVKIKKIIDALIQTCFDKNDADVQMIERNPIG